MGNHSFVSAVKQANLGDNLKFKWFLPFVLLHKQNKSQPNINSKTSVGLNQYEAIKLTSN